MPHFQLQNGRVYTVVPPLLLVLGCLTPETFFAQSPRLDSIQYLTQRESYTSIYTYTTDRDFNVRRRYHHPSDSHRIHIDIFRDSLLVFHESSQAHHHIQQTTTYDTRRRKTQETTYLNDTVVHEIKYRYHADTKLPVYKLTYWTIRGDTTDITEKHIRYDAQLREIEFSGYTSRYDTLVEQYEYHLSYPAENIIRRQGLGFHKHMGYSLVDYSMTEHILPPQIFGDTLCIETRHIRTNPEGVPIDSTISLRCTWGEKGIWKAGGNMHLDFSNPSGWNTRVYPIENGIEVHSYRLSSGICSTDETDEMDWRAKAKTRFFPFQTSRIHFHPSGKPLEMVTTSTENGETTISKYFYADPREAQLSSVRENIKPGDVRIVHALDPDAIYFDYSGKRVTQPPHTLLLIEVKAEGRQRVLFVQ